MQEVKSPKEYNFYNDSINVEIEVDLDAVLLKLIKLNSEFSDYISGQYTSYDGFMSSHSSDSNDWILDIKNNGDLSHKLGACLGFLLLCHGTEEDGMIEYCADKHPSSSAS